MFGSKFKRGKLPYSHHHTRVRIGSDGLDCDLDIALTELSDIKSYLEDVKTGLLVVGVDNKQINVWLDKALDQVADTARTMDSLVDQLLELPEIACTNKHYEPRQFSHFIEVKGEPPNRLGR